MISDVIRQAQRMHRAVIEQTYDGQCSIYGMLPVKDPVSKVTRQAELLIQAAIPCHLSFSSTAPSVKSDTTASALQSIKLFLAPELSVPPGCRIEVTQTGRTETYYQSGKAAIYPSHQEITLLTNEKA